MTPVYETDDNYLIAHQNWAFSYSGAEAQIIGWKLYDARLLPIMLRLPVWKLTFQLIGSLRGLTFSRQPNLQMIEKIKL